MQRLFNEPVALATAIRLVLLAGMTFGLPFTENQIIAVMAAIEAVLFLVTRALVTPNQVAEARVAAGGSPTVPMGKP